MLLTDKEIGEEANLLYCTSILECRAIAKAQLIKNTDAIDSMVADGWYLEDIVKAMRKEAE